MQLSIYKQVLLMLLAMGLLSSCNKSSTIVSGNLRLEFNNKMQSKVNSVHELAKPISDNYCVSEYIETNNFKTGDFNLTKNYVKQINNNIGKGNETILLGNYKQNGANLTKIVSVLVYDSFPNIAVINVSYINNGDKDLLIKKWVNNKYNILAQNTAPNFWSFQGSSSAARADWVLPLKPGFIQQNFMGMNNSDYGGGIPVVDLWRKDAGLAVGHLDLAPQEVSLPVFYGKYSNHAIISVEKEFNDLYEFKIGDTLKTLETFVAVHSGDYYQTMRLFSDLMQKKGIKFVEPEPEAFEAMWCAWGYMRKFTADEVLATLPKVKELGIKWVCVDDGYQIAEGDWRVDKSRFKGGEKDIKKLVDVIHSYGMKAQLWWAPMAADPGSDILKKDPSMVLYNSQGAPQYITWWDSYYLSPAYQGTIDYTNQTIKMFLNDWGFDGLKLDGQHMNAVPAEYNFNRPLEYPEKSIEMLPGFFENIYNTARGIKPNAIIQNCPCGCCMSFYNMAHTNQFVASDPTSSWQIRLKGKTYKAIAPQAAYFGDHVELSDNGNDFASSFGIGAVLGTKFTWPNDNPFAEKGNLLTKEREQIWKKWFNLYEEKKLSKEKYLGNLYDIGYDIPETHVIKKGNELYYAFYNNNWNGTVSLRGLQSNKTYRLYDYFNNVELGSINSNNANVNLTFKGFLLMVATPVE